MTIKELEKYCKDQAIKCVQKSTRADNVLEERYAAGQANAFFWIAAIIQNNELPKGYVDSIR